MSPHKAKVRRPLGALYISIDKKVAPAYCISAKVKGSFCVFGFSEPFDFGYIEMGLVPPQELHTTWNWNKSSFDQKKKHISYLTTIYYL